MPDMLSTDSVIAHAKSIWVLDVVAGILGVFILSELTRLRKGEPRCFRLPPGPKPLPFIGNLLDMPKGKDWLHWAKHKDTYGPISSVSAFGSHLIVINDPEVAYELLDKRSNIYSSRPILTFGGEMCGWSRSTIMLRYGEVLKMHRRYIHKFLGTKASIASFHGLIDDVTRLFVLDVLKDPEQLLAHIRTAAGAIILKVAYGYTVDRQGEDPLVDLAERAIRQFSDATRPGVWLVDFMPFFRKLPVWFPGATFHSVAQKYRKDCSDFANTPYSFVRARMAAGEALPSYTSSFFAKDVDPNADDEEYIVKWSSASLYAGGADTTVSALYTFYLAMMLYPDVLRRAQEEIDTVVGTDRLPSLKDRARLPFVNAVQKEILRWNPIVPMGFPHVTTEDDSYRGYFIPKGALVLTNIWQFTHESQIYSEPMSFKPERFIDAAECDPSDFVWGFGRRICPGKELADVSLFLAVAMSLAVFDISKPRNDKTGEEIEPVYEYTSGIVSHPTTFKCHIAPRSKKHLSLITAIQGTAQVDSKDAEILANLK